MSTQAIIHVSNKDELIMTVYKHWDGYPDGVGKTIKDILGDRKVVNGIRGGADLVVNGMDNAAAILVAGLKSDMEAGDVYIRAPNISDRGEYTYFLSDKDGDIQLKLLCSYENKPLYEGSLKDFDPNLLNEKDEELSEDATVLLASQWLNPRNTLTFHKVGS